MNRLFRIIFLMLPTLSFAQRSINPDEINLRKGVQFYEEENYKEAIPYFKGIADNGNANEEVLYYLASSYAYSGDFANAVNIYEQLFSSAPNYSLIAYYECGYALQELGQYEKSIPKFKSFLEKNPGNAKYYSYVHRAKYKIKYAESQVSMQNIARQMKAPAPLSDIVNTRYAEYLPMLDPTGKKLYFTSSRKGGISEELADDADFDEDLYYIEKINGSWASPKLLPEPINTANNDGAASFSVDGQTMIYGACGKDDGVGSCDLYIAYLEGTKWSKPVNMGNVVNSSEWDGHSTISYDGNRIIFASSRAGGYGATDLYMTERNIFGDWGVPMNLGSMVNTPFNEYSPFISQDGKTLYFSSDGHPGFGGQDIFRSVYENGKWSEPVNLGKPLNTDGNDRYFTIGGSGELGYFSSDRGGNLDLYQIEIPEDMRPQPTVVVGGAVTDVKTGKPVGAYVLVEDLNTGELIAVNKSNSATGKYLIVLPAGITYSVSANKEAYFFYSQKFDVPMSSKFEEIKLDIGLKPIEKGAKVVLNNIFFETGKATLSPQSRLELQKAIDLLKANQSMIIEVGGHTDNVGEDAANMKLSHDRAKAVRDYLVNAGIAPARLQAKGYGESNPIASNDTDNGRQANRRTEFIILEFGN